MLGWAEHVADTRFITAALEGKRSIGRTKNRWYHESLS
jgi:hypothetical protein